MLDYYVSSKNAPKEKYEFFKMPIFTSTRDRNAYVVVGLCIRIVNFRRNFINFVI